MQAPIPLQANTSKPVTSATLRGERLRERERRKVAITVILADGGGGGGRSNMDGSHVYFSCFLYCTTSTTIVHSHYYMHLFNSLPSGAGTKFLITKFLITKFLIIKNS